MRLPSMLLSLLLSCCSSGHLDAFSRDVQASGGASSGGASSGGASGGSTPLGGTSSAGSSSGGMMQPGAGGQLNGTGGNVSTTLVLDDFEDGNTETVVRDGWWYVTPDRATAETTPNAIVMDPNASVAHSGARALRVYGGGCKSWCFLGVDLPGTPYLDGTAYIKLSFWARIEPSSTVRSLSVDVLDGTNVGDSANPAHFRNILELTPQWGNYTLIFSQLVPTEGPATASVDRSRLAQIQFWIFTPDAFDFSLDDLVFMP